MPRGSTVTANTSGRSAVQRSFAAPFCSIRRAHSFGQWLTAASRRLHCNVLTVALANKLARIALTVLVQKRDVGLAHLYTALLNGALCSRPSWISAHIRSHSRQGPRRPEVPPDHGCDGEDRFSIFSIQLADLGRNPGVVVQTFERPFCFSYAAAAGVIRV